MARLLLVSPYPTVRAGLRALLGTMPDVEIVGEAHGVADLNGPWPGQPEIALVDAAGGMAAVEAIEARAPEVAIILLGAERTIPARSWGAAPRGFLTSDATAEELATAVQAVAHGLTVIEPALMSSLLSARPSAQHEVGPGGDEPLTAREIEVLHLLAAGLPNKTIALRLGISEHTAKFHVSSVLGKLGAASRTEAVTTAARRGLLLL
jgi:DNA-binding NarL/FixJ family response regulator